MTEQLQIAGVEDVRARWDEFDACFTPAPVVQQLVEVLPTVVRMPRRGRLLDPCAGAGVVGMIARRLLKGWKLTAVEPRGEELRYLERHYDLAYTATAQDFASALVPAPYDLVVTNPPWWCWGDVFDAVWPLVLKGGALAFLGPSTWGHSDEASECIGVFERVCPAYQLRVRGRIAFNGGAGTDNRKCSWWIWVCDGVARRGWMTETLPPLPAEARRWHVRPGTEE